MTEPRDDRAQVGKLICVLRAVLDEFEHLDDSDIAVAIAYIAKDHFKNPRCVKFIIDELQRVGAADH